MKVYLKNKLGVVFSVELEKNNMIEEFVSKIQDNGGIEKVRVNMITSSCNCGTDLTDFLLQDIDKEITLNKLLWWKSYWKNSRCREKYGLPFSISSEII